MSASLTSVTVCDQRRDSRDDDDSSCIPIASLVNSRFEDNVALWFESTEQSKKRENERMARIRERERQETANLHKRYMEERQKKEQEKSQQQGSSRSINNSHGAPAAKQPRTTMEDNQNTDWRQPVRSMGALASNMTLMDSRFGTFPKAPPPQHLVQTNQCTQAPSTSAMFGGFYSTGGMIVPTDQQFTYTPHQSVTVSQNQRMPTYATPPSMNGSANCETPSSSTSTPMRRTPSTATPQQQAATPPALEVVTSSASSAEEQFETNIIQNIGTLPQLDGNLFEQEVDHGAQPVKKSRNPGFVNNLEPVNQSTSMQMPACQFPMEPQGVNVTTYQNFPPMPGPAYSHVYPSHFMPQHPMFIHNSYPKREYPPGFAPMPSQQQQIFLQHQQQQHHQMSQQNGYAAMGVMPPHPPATVPMQAGQPPNGVLYTEMHPFGYQHYI